jgi:UDP-N-acetylglucosamine 2-epimerase (non-hydrolysing)
MRIVSIAGAPSDVVNLAAVYRALDERADVEHVIVQTGRPDDAGMATLCEELEIPRPHRSLDVRAGGRGGPHGGGVETGLIMQRLEPLLAELGPETVLVYGSGNAALAAALVAAKLGMRVGHVEAGLRSGDRAPEEINRVVTDRLADPLLVSSRDAIGALKAEGVAEERIQFVGSVRIDALTWALTRAPASDGGTYAVASLHTPAAEIIQALAELERRIPVVTAPGGYLEVIGLMAGAALVITDTDDLQEETTYLGVPCITLRSSTDHPATCQHGTNRLVAAGRTTLLAAADRALARRAPARPVLERWDGRAAERIARVLCDGTDFPAEAAQAAAPATRPTRQAVAIPQMA